MQVTKMLLGALAVLCLTTTSYATDFFNHHRADIVRERIPTVRLQVFAPHNRVQRQREFVEERVKFVDRHGRIVEEIRRVPVERQIVRDRVRTHERLVRRGNLIFRERLDNHGRVLLRERFHTSNRDRLINRHGVLLLERQDGHGRVIQRLRVH